MIQLKVKKDIVICVCLQGEVNVRSFSVRDSLNYNLRKFKLSTFGCIFMYFFCDFERKKHKSGTKLYI